MIDLYYSRMNWNINPAQMYIQGDIQHRFKMVVGGVSSISFDLESVLMVDSIKRNGSHIPFTHTADLITIYGGPWPAVGVEDSVRIYYKGAPAGSGFGSFAQSSHAGTPIIWTLSEPYGSMEWWPCKNGLDDKIDSIDVIVTCPKQYRAASNGLLVKETVVGQNRICEWHHRYPIATYLVAIAVTNYAVYNNYVALHNGSTLPILNYVFPEDSASAAASTQVTVPILAYYDSTFHDYPFHKEKYGHAQFGWGGGMEHQTMSFMGGFSYGLIAHELAHMWYGDMITCGSWEDIWLNEGFATYLTGLSYERFSPNNSWPSWKTSTINHVLNDSTGSVFCSDTTSVGRIFSSRLSYSKGALLLHQLRWVVGDSAFFEGMRNYMNDPSVAYGYALTPDFQYHMQASSGMNLTEFFNDWYYGQGWPIYSSQVVWLKDFEYHVFINQTQSHPSVSFFEMPVPLRFKGPNLDTIIVFDHTYTGQMWTVTLPSKVDSVFFDPEKWLCARFGSTTVGTEDIHPPMPVKVYPNPTGDVLWIDGLEAREFLGVVDLAGRRVDAEPIAGVSRFGYDVSNLKAGIYFLQVRDAEGLGSVRFIKQ